MKRSAGGERGFTLVEATVSLAIVSVLVTSTLELAGRSARAQALAGRRAQGALLAQAILDEARERAYADPGPLPLFGPELGEGTADRRDFDDVDDYHNYNENTITDATGSVITGLNGWSRRVTVSWVDPAAPNVTSLVETGVKRVRVTVDYNTERVARAFALVVSAP